MKIRNISTIISREYFTRVKKKSFLLTTFLVPVIFAAMCILPSVIMFMAKDSGKQVAVVDQSGFVMPYLSDTEEVDYVDHSTESVEDMKSRFKELSLDVLLVVSLSVKISLNRSGPWIVPNSLRVPGQIT